MESSEVEATSSRRIGSSHLSFGSTLTPLVTRQATPAYVATHGQINSGGITLARGCRQSPRSFLLLPDATLNLRRATAPMTLSRLGILALALGVTEFARAQSPIECHARPAASQAVERGWMAYRKGDISNAESEFKRALALCANDAGALTGAGYAAMRQGRLTDARNFFRRAVAADSTSYDAVTGAGMAAYRAGDPASARRSFERALRIAPGDSTALSYLARIPVPIADAGPTTRARPTTTTIVSRTGKRIFEIRDAAGRWSPLWIKAVNLGAALPGNYPSEFPPIDSTYERWIALIAVLGANSVRLYTIHPPHFLGNASTRRSFYAERALR
jgi:Tfp pilus assembly protein PilF